MNHMKFRILPSIACPERNRILNPAEYCGVCHGSGYHINIPNWYKEVFYSNNQNDPEAPHPLAKKVWFSKYNVVLGCKELQEVGWLMPSIEDM